MARGGRRAPTPGRTYGNRTDLQQPVRVVSDQPYGERKRLEEAQKVIPLPNQGAGVAPSPTQPTAPAPAPAPILPFTRPTDRPDEHVTTAPPNMNDQPDIIGAQLQALYRLAPNNDILRVLELHQRGY